MSVKRDQQDLMIKEAYRKWQVLKIEVREARGLLNLAVGVMQLELEQVQARMMDDLERLDDEIASICAEIKVAYGKAGGKSSFELEEQLKLRKIERRKLILQMGALADESLCCGKYWESYTELAKETEELRSNLERLQHEAEEARSNYRQIVFQEKLAV